MTRSAPTRFHAVAPILVLGCAGMLLSCAPVAVKPVPPAPPTEGKVRGLLVAQGVSVPLDGAVVEAGGKKTTVTGGGIFAFPDLDPGKQYVVVEKTFTSGSVRRILGVATIFVADNPVQIRIPVRDATDVDAFCLDCHPPYGKVTRRDQKYRDGHPSGVVAGKALGDKSLLDFQGRVTCESCHTVHRPGQFPLFGVGDIRKGSYCNRCHSSKRQ